MNFPPSWRNVLAMAHPKLSKPCPCCDGSGLVLDSQKVATIQKQFRRDNGVTLAEVAKAMKCSIGYVSDLENARPGKPWNLALIERHTNAVALAKRAKLKT